MCPNFLKWVVQSCILIWLDKKHYTEISLLRLGQVVQQIDAYLLSLNHSPVTSSHSFFSRTFFLLQIILFSVSLISIILYTLPHLAKLNYLSVHYIPAILSPTAIIPTPVPHFYGNIFFTYTCFSYHIKYLLYHWVPYGYSRSSSAKQHDKDYICSFCLLFIYVTQNLIIVAFDGSANILSSRGPINVFQSWT